MSYLFLECFKQDVGTAVLLLGMLLRDFSAIGEHTLNVANDVLDQVDYNSLLLEMLIKNDFLRLFMYRVVEGKSCFLVNWIKDPKVWPKSSF